MVICGRPVTITGGHLHFFGGETDGVEGVRQTIRQLVKEGADFVKIVSSGGSTRSSHPYRPAFTPPELSAPEPLRLYRLRAACHELHVAAGDPTYGTGADRRVGVDPWS